MAEQVPVSEIGYTSELGVDGQFWHPSETTPELRWPLSVRVFEQMARQDPQIVSVMRACSLPIRRARWSIDPNGAKKRVTELVANDLGLPIKGKKTKPRIRGKNRFSWQEHLRHALLCQRYGHMFFETVYNYDERDGYYHLRKLGPRMPSTISNIKVGRDGGLESIEQYGFDASKDSTTIPVNRLVAYVHDREGGDWTGMSLLRPAYKHWLIKDVMLRVGSQTIERNGMGVAVYEAGELDGQAEMAAGLKIAKSYKAGSASGAATPHGAKLRLAAPEGNLPDARPWVEYQDEQIARAVLAHFLNLGKQTGSWALGSTLGDFFVDSLQTEAEMVADTANYHVVEDLVEANFGPDEPAPRIVFEEIGSQRAAIAADLKLLKDAGILIPDRVLEAAVRLQYNLPEADEESATPEVLPPAPPTAPDGTPPPTAQMLAELSAWNKANPRPPAEETS